MNLLKSFLIPQKKSANSNISCSTSRSSFVDFLYGNGHYDLGARQSVNYYKQVAPLFTAIDLISEHVKAIDPIIWNKLDDEPIHQHPIQILFDSPNADATWQELIQRAASFLLITGNCYIVALGAVNRPPKELYVVPSQNVTLESDSTGITETITVSSGYINSVFTRKEVNGRYRYYDGTLREIYHIRLFNPNQIGNSNFGMSPLTPIYSEIEQYLSASTHNLSQLKRGATISAIISFEDPISDDDETRLQQQMDQFYSGASNAGRSMILGNRANISNMNTSNKDMDFLNLKKSVEHSIYNALKVPLALVSADQMTLSNLETSVLNLYDNAVLPLAKTLYRELTLFLFPRYPNSENLSLSYDENDISALDIRREQKVKSRKELDIYTIDELRSMQGSEPLGSGANVVYRPSNLFPVAVDSEAADTSDSASLSNRFRTLLQSRTQSEISESENVAENSVE